MLCLAGVVTRCGLSPPCLGDLLRSSLYSQLSLDTRDDLLLPASGVHLSGSHLVSTNHTGQYSHTVGYTTTHEQVFASQRNIDAVDKNVSRI